MRHCQGGDDEWSREGRKGSIRSDVDGVKAVEREKTLISLITFLSGCEGQTWLGECLTLS